MSSSTKSANGAKIPAVTRPSARYGVPTAQSRDPFALFMLTMQYPTDFTIKSDSPPSPCPDFFFFPLSACLSGRESLDKARWHDT